MQTISIMLGDFSDIKDYLAIVEKCPNMVYARDKAGREINAKGIINEGNTLKKKKNKK